MEVYPELRTQTQARRFRVPDVLVVRTGDTFNRYITRPPLIAIEILSPEDTLRALQIIHKDHATMRPVRFGPVLEQGWDGAAVVGEHRPAQFGGLEQATGIVLAHQTAAFPLHQRTNWQRFHAAA